MHHMHDENPTLTLSYPSPLDGYPSPYPTLPYPSLPYPTYPKL